MYGTYNIYFNCELLIVHACMYRYVVRPTWFGGVMMVAEVCETLVHQNAGVTTLI